MDEQAAMLGDWVLPSPSPKAFIPSFLGDDAQFSFGPMRQMTDEDKDAKQGDFSFNNDIILRPLPEHNKSSSRGGLADRIAARAGFNPPRLNTESIRLNDRSSIDEVKSSYLTIPSGISPTSLLESPVFISNSLTQASPTTGKFQLLTDGSGKGFSMDRNSTGKDNILDNVNDSSSFAFKPYGEPGLPFSLSAAYKMSQNMNPQALSDISVSVRTENASENFEPSQVHSYESLSKSLTDKESGDKITGSELHVDTISGTSEQSPPLSDQQNDEGDQTIGVDSMAGGSAGVGAEDGYHWRKYGQKHVRGSEFPRSYYRCTYINCPVKKKVERSPEGIITEIIYKGAHYHPEPAPNRTSSMGSSQFDNIHNQGVPENGVDRISAWGAACNGPFLQIRDWRNGSFEQNSMTLMNPEIRHPLSSMEMQNGILESGDVAAGSSTYSNDEGQNDCRTHGSISIANDEEGDESESKRRRTETFAAEELGSGATRAIREPRVVVQTRSDVDILDDGYRWRKYGQKVVKGNPNPRSYYRCTHIGCSVRKHVERASNDVRSVITTYEGKHNHDVPAARSSSHVNSTISAALASLPQNLPPHGFPMGMNQPSLVGFSPVQNKSVAHPYPMQQQQSQVKDMGFMMPRGQPNSAPNNLYLSDGSSGYTNRLPLGPLKPFF